MKKSLLFSSLLFVVLSATARDSQIEKVALFDFHNPQTLTPAVDFNGGSVVDVTGREFVSKDATFKPVRTSKSLAPVINQNIKPGWCGFQFPARAAMVVSVPAGYQLQSIDLRQGFYNGVGTYNVETVPSGLAGTYFQGLWTATDANGHDLSGITSVTLTNPFGLDAVFSSVKVTYLAPADVLTYSTISPAMDEETDPFTGYTLTFGTAVTVKEGAVFTVKNAADEDVCTLQATTIGKTLQLTPAKPITLAGSYKLVIPEGAIVNEDGEYNQAFTATFSVKDHPDTFAYTAISLEPGRVKEVPQVVTMTFPADVQTVPAVLTFSNSDNTMTKDATVTIDAGNAKNVILDFGADITALDTYSCTIAAQQILAADGTHYNPEFTLSYTVMGYDVPSDALVAMADSLLHLTGVGYPKTSSAERDALASVVNGENKSRQDYEAAISNYLSTTDIVYPAYGSYYILSKMVAAGDAENAFLGFDGTFYQATEADAEHFLFVDIEGDRFVQMTDGTQKAVTLTKATAAAPQDAFGLFNVTIDGFTDTLEGLGYKLTLTTSRDPKNLTTILPADGTQTDEVTEVVITVAQAETINYHTEKAIRILKGDEVIATVTNYTINGNKLSFPVKLVPSATTIDYVVDMPKGAITYYSIDHQVEVPAMTATYSISTAYGFSSFTSKYSIFITPSSDGFYTPDEMNEVSVMSNATELFVNPDHCVTRIESSNGTTLCTGTLEKDATKTLDADGMSVLKFKFNQTFTRDNLPDGLYTFVIEKGSFGDENYGQYLADPTSKAKHECYVNSMFYYVYTVDYETATGITTVKAVDPAAEVFDLAGRRVKGAAKAGVYVVNGKKVVVK